MDDTATTAAAAETRAAARDDEHLDFARTRHRKGAAICKCKDIVFTKFSQYGIGWDIRDLHAAKCGERAN